MESSRTHFEVSSKHQVLENWPILGSRTALFFELFRFCGAPEKIFERRFFFGDRLKKNFEDFFLESTCACVLGLGLEHSCPWPREGLSSERLS